MLINELLIKKSSVLPKEYLNAIRSYLRDLINKHRPTMELNNNNNNNNNNNKTEWKIQLAMQNSCISTKSFEETRTIYTKSEALKVCRVVIQKISFINFNTLLQRFQRAQETSNERGSEFIRGSVELLYYNFQRIEIRRAESYIMSPDWLASTPFFL